MNEDGLKLHALFVPTPNGPAVLHLSQSFHIELDGKNRTISIRVADAKDHRREDTRFASFHTLYGENGCGKTKLMLALCENFGKQQGHRRFGVLFSDGTDLCIVLGQALGGWRINKKLLSVRFVKHPPTLKSIFYSTSPFEHRRRTPLRSLSVQDVSPTHGDRFQCDALDLVRAFPYLKGLGTFVDDVEIRFDVRLPKPTQHLKILLTMWQRRVDFSPTGQRDARASLFATLTKYLPQSDQEVFAVELAIAINATSSSRNPTWVKLMWDELEKRDHLIQANTFNPRIARAIYLIIKRRILRHEVLLGSIYAPEEIVAFCRSRFLGERPAISRKESLHRIEELVLQEEWSRQGIAYAAVQSGVVDLHLERLSSGEAAFISLYSALGRALSKAATGESSDPIFLLIDEGEMFMHPRWQQQFVSNIIRFISNFKNLSSRIHVIISTHSLIVAADVPPHSLFDLQNAVMRNGFGLGPKSVLQEIYGVSRFTGENAAQAIDRILNYLKGDVSVASVGEVAELARNLADKDLRDYVRRAMIKRGNNAEAERLVD